MCVLLGSLSNVKNQIFFKKSHLPSRDQNGRPRKPRREKRDSFHPDFGPLSCLFELSPFSLSLIFSYHQHYTPTLTAVFAQETFQTPNNCSMASSGNAATELLFVARLRKTKEKRKHDV